MSGANEGRGASRKLMIGLSPRILRNKADLIGPKDALLFMSYKN